MNGGESWFEITDGLEPEHNEFYQIIIYPDNHDILFLSSQNEGVYVSIDAGEHWENINSELGNLKAAGCNNIAMNLVLDEENDILYLGTLGDGLWKLDVSGFSSEESSRSLPDGNKLGLKRFAPSFSLWERIKSWFT